MQFLSWALAIALSASAFSGETLKSGPQPGEELPSSFEPLVVSGPNAGRNHCLVCENGLNPVAMVFAREPSAALIKLLSKFEATCDKHQSSGLGSFAVFLSKDESLDKKLEAAARKNRFEHVVLSIDEPEGPAGYKVSADADVTVVLYDKHKVEANHAFRAGALNDETIEKIMADLGKMLGKKDVAAKPPRKE